MVSPSMDCQLALTMTSIIIGPSLAIYISQVRAPRHDSLDTLPSFVEPRETSRVRVANINFVTNRRLKVEDPCLPKK